MTEAYAIKLAKLFHDTYERLAPNFGYETRKETKHFDTESVNGRLMIATCQAIIDAGVIVSEKSKCRLCEGQGWTTQPDPRNGYAAQVQCEPCLGTGTVSEKGEAEVEDYVLLRDAVNALYDVDQNLSSLLEAYLSRRQ